MLKKLFFLHCIALAFIKSVDCIYVALFLGSRFCSVNLFVSSFTNTTCLDDWGFLVNLEVRYCQSSHFVLFPWCCVGYSGSFASPTKHWDTFVYIHKLTCCYFGWDFIESIDQVGKNEHLDSVESSCLWKWNISICI